MACKPLNLGLAGKRRAATKPSLLSGSWVPVYVGGNANDVALPLQAVSLQPRLSTTQGQKLQCYLLPKCHYSSPSPALLLQLPNYYYYSYELS